MGTGVLLLVQVGEPPSLYSKRSSNLCLLLFPCPSVLCETIADCAHVCKQLLLCGDVELDPGPPRLDPDLDSSGADVGVLAASAAMSAKLDGRHSEVRNAFAELKKNQEMLTRTVSDLSTRLAALESVIESLEACHPQLSSLV